jgi:hypothetical protein
VTILALATEFNALKEGAKTKLQGEMIALANDAQNSGKGATKGLLVY